MAALAIMAAATGVPVEPAAAGGPGGGICNDSTGLLWLDRCIVRGNASGAGSQGEQPPREPITQKLQVAAEASAVRAVRAALGPVFSAPAKL